MITILAFVFIIVASFYAYKSAKDYERNAVMWAFIVFGVGFGLQIVIPFIIGIIISLVMIAGGKTLPEIQESMYSYLFIINIFFIILSIVAMFLILRYLGTVPDDDIYTPNQPPPPPPEFDEN